MNATELFNLEGRVALVTGCAQGLGREIAMGLAQSGCSLVLADVVDPVETAGQVAELGARSISVKADISDEAAVVAMVEKSIREYKRVDILVNNAGISQMSFTPTEDSSVEEWDRILAVNLRGTFLCCKYVGRQMIAGGGGSIVNISSTAGVVGVMRAPAYCASKAGVILLTKSLALEWARHHVRVNAIAPHYLETDLTKVLRDSEKVYEGIVRHIPMRRFAKPIEVVGTVLHLTSPAASYITGTVFTVDGGFTAQ